MRFLEARDIWESSTWLPHQALSWEKLAFERSEAGRILAFGQQRLSLRVCMGLGISVLEQAAPEALAGV